MKLLTVNFWMILGFISASFFGGNLSVKDDIIFRNGIVENLYPKYVLFRVEICGRSSTSYVTFNYISHLSGTWEKATKTLNEGKTGYGCYKYKYFLETQNFYVPPFFQIEYFWSVTEGTKVLGQSSKDVYTYKNEGYIWKNLKDEHFAIWWHDRPDSFGQEVMSVATLAFNDQAKFYSYSLESPVTIVITNTSEEFYAWQPMKHNMIGMAFSEIFLTIQLVEDNADYSDSLDEIIPHEISHIYFNHLAKKDSAPPRWLDEGLATYNEYSNYWGRWIKMKTAYEAGEILPLKDLKYDFDEDPERLYLAYSESYYAVLYMDEVYGRDAIATLLHEYSKGTDTTAAFEKSFGKDPERFETDFMVWLAERLKTPPPGTDLQQPISQDVVVYFFAGMLCLGILFVTGAGTILIVILVMLNNNHTKKQNEIKASG